MHIVIAGGHGQIALLLTERLAARGDTVRGLIRDASQEGDVRDVGGEPVLFDLEEDGADELADHLGDADGVVFAAGAGPGSGAERKETVDYGGAVTLLDAARRAGVGRYVIISSMGAEDPPDDDDVFSVYLRAKSRADRAVMDSDLDWTVVRPGRLTDDEAVGTVTLDRRVARGEIPRADVAAVLAHVLHDDRTSGHVFEVVGGDTPIGEAIDTLVGA